MIKIYINFKCNYKDKKLCFNYRYLEDLIKRLEQVGLGYYVDVEKIIDRMGKCY